MTYEKYKMDITLFEDDCVYAGLQIASDAGEGGAGNFTNSFKPYTDK